MNKDSRKKQIKICSSCKHRKMNMKMGLICGLTSEKADFDNECLQYEKDPKKGGDVSGNVPDPKAEEEKVLFSFFIPIFGIYYYFTERDDISNARVYLYAVLARYALAIMLFWISSM